MASFDNGVLTIMLNDGSTVSGSVTGDTKLECTAPSTDTRGQDGNDDGDHGQNSGDGGDGGKGSGNNGDDGSGEDQGDDAQMCSTSALSTGTPVSEANLKITNAGAIWQEVDLITS